MLHRVLPISLLRGHWKSLSDYRGEGKPGPDRFTRWFLIVIPVLAAGAMLFYGGTLAAPDALLSGVALLAGALLAAFAQLSDVRLILTSRMRDYPDAERIDRDALDETASHLLVAAYGSAVTAFVLVLGMNFGAEPDTGAIGGVWAALASGLGSYVLIVFLIAVPRLYSAYVTHNKVRAELSGSHRG